MLSRSELETSVEEVLLEELNRIYAVVPYVGHLTAGDEAMNEAYYLRHRVETIKRIRLTSKTDALALVHMIDEDYQAARWWSQYLAQELDHDRLYLMDLEQHGFTAEEVEAIPPFAATEAMIEYLTEKIATAGSLAAVAYSVAVEWNSERASLSVVHKAETQFSEAHARGAKIHVGIDEQDDHYEMMLDVAHRLLPYQQDSQVLFHLLREICGFLGQYFQELYEATILDTHGSSSWADKHSLSSIS